MVKSELLYDRISLGEELDSDSAAYALPSRALFASMYTLFKRRQFSANEYEYISAKVMQQGDNICKVRVAILAMSELGLVSIGEDSMISVPEVSEKFDLNSAQVMKYILKFTERG